MNVTEPSHTYDPCSYLKVWSFVARRMILYVLLVVGVPSNIISFIVFLKKHKESICRYLLLLAVFDTFALVFEVMGRSDVGDMSDAACIGVHYTRYFLKFMSHFLVLMASLETCYKIGKGKEKFTPPGTKRVAIQVVIALVYSLGANGYMFVTQGLNTCHQCNAKSEYARLNLYCYLALNFVPMEVITCLILIVCSIVSLAKLGNEKKRKTSVDIGKVSYEKKQISRESEFVDASDWVKMMVVVMVMFVLLRLPYSCSWLYDYIHYQVPTCFIVN